MNKGANKIRIATTSLAGCFGCHMSFLDMDERFIDLVELVSFDRMPLTDIKTLSLCHIGLIEGGVCNSENVEVLREFRQQCTILIAVGACAINGGVPAMRNQYDLQDCLRTAFVDGPGIEDGQIPSDPELPLLLDKVRPVQEVVTIDHYLPGCPPSADAIWSLLQQLLHQQPVELSYQQVHYD